MELRESINEFIHENFEIEFTEENLKIRTSSKIINYKIESLDKSLVLKVLSFVSKLTSDNKFIIESLIEEEICLLNKKYDMEFTICIDKSENHQDEYTKISNLIDLLDTIVESHPDINIMGISDSQSIVVSNDEWASNIYFNYDDLDIFPEDIDAFFNYTYEENRCLYTNDYIEYVIDFPELKSIFGYIGLPEAYCSEHYKDKIYYEITKVSLPLFNLIMKEQEYGNEEEYEHHENLSLKVFNINSVLGIPFTDSKYKDYALKVTKNFLFHLSMKYNINLKILDKSVYEIDAEDIVATLSEKLELIQESDLIYKHDYDADLIQYYYQASLMEDSPFKYLAYYQVIECIYDEVLMANTVGDIQQLINSPWFNANEKTDIQKIIEKIKWHNNSKKDEDKLKLVMEKYFRNNASDDIFLEVNKEIIDLSKKMKIIKEDIDFKDLQKLQKQIYRFRCDCTHSNRTYPISKIDDENSIQDYIKLIKLIAERIILNYR